MLKDSLENSIFEICDNNEYEFPGSYIDLSIFLKKLFPDVGIFLNNILMMVL